MDSTTPRKNASATAVTLDEVPSGSTVRQQCPHVALVEGSGPGLSGETRSLLRSRLRAAALMLCLGFGVFLVWSVFSIDLSQSIGIVVLSAHIATTIILGVSAFALCRTCPVRTTTGKLRALEIVVFGVPALFFLLTQYTRMHACAELGYMPRMEGGWLLLIFTYALFIPNTWKRAAVAVGLMAAAPVMMVLALWGSHAVCAHVVGSDISKVAELVLKMSLSGVVAVVGVHMIGTLRQQAFAARELGQYRLRQRIGGGGMGEVYLAEHQLMKRPCAIKVIHPEKAGDPQVLARFEREVRATAKLSHWNNIDIYDYGRADDGTFYYVMEFLPGMNLQDLISRYGPLPAERVIYLLQQTCDALEEAHGIGLIHRDIKPANLFAAQRGGLYDVSKLLDFGLAKPTAEPTAVDLTQEGAITGSPLFMSPEQATGDIEPDGRSDIYSLGAVAYYMLTGRPPFMHDNAIKVLMAHAGKEVPKPSEFQPDVPADLEQVVLRCLEKDPADRYQSAVELAAALQQCQSAGLWNRTLAAQWWQRNSEEIAAPREAALALG